MVDLAWGWWMSAAVVVTMSLLIIRRNTLALVASFAQLARGIFASMCFRNTKTGVANQKLSISLPQKPEPLVTPGALLFLLQFKQEEHGDDADGNHNYLPQGVEFFIRFFMEFGNEVRESDVDEATGGEGDEPSGDNV